MTFQTEIDAALAKPVDDEIYEQSKYLAREHGLIIQHEEHTENLHKVFYALLLRIRELENQVQQERWIPVTERLPSTIISCLMFDLKTETFERGFFSEKDRKFYVENENGLEEFAATHWKPINLPA